MPELSFAPGNKSASVFDLDVFRLAMSQKARVVILDKAAKMQLTHYITSGEVQENGRRKGKYYVCLGEYDKVMSQGTDPEKCPFCRASEPSKEAIVQQARRRFALHLARYTTNNQAVPIKPISIRLEVWQFGDDKFNKLVDRAQEHGDLRTHDLVITCTAAQYQNYDFDVSPHMILKGDASAEAQYRELLKSRQDLERLLGSPVSYDAAERLVGLGTVQAADSVSTVDIDKMDSEFTSDFSSLLDSDDPVAPAVSNGATTNGATSAPASKPLASAPASKPSTSAKAAAPAVDVAKSSVEEVDFSSLLDN